MKKSANQVRHILTAPIAAMLIIIPPASAQELNSPPPIVVPMPPQKFTKAEIANYLKEYSLNPKTIKMLFSSTKLDKVFFEAYLNYTSAVYNDDDIVDFMAADIESRQTQYPGLSKPQAAAEGTRNGRKMSADMVGSGLQRLGDEDIQKYLYYASVGVEHPACGNTTPAIPGPYVQLHAISQLGEAALRDFFDLRFRAMRAAATEQPDVRQFDPEDAKRAREFFRDALVQHLLEFPEEKRSRLAGALDNLVKVDNPDACEGIAQMLMIMRNMEGETGTVLRISAIGDIGKLIPGQ